jgi:hypothetical protein
LSRYQVYLDWEYSERQRREAFPESHGGSVSAFRSSEERERARRARIVWAAKRAAWESVMGGLPDAPSRPAELTVPPTPQLPGLPATKPGDIRALEWVAARGVMQLQRQGLWPRKQQGEQLKALNAYLEKIRADKVSPSTMKNALAWLKRNGWLIDR